MNRSLVGQLASELQACWTEGAPIEAIERLEHQLFDSILTASQSDISPSIIKELELVSPQSLFYESEYDELKKYLKIEKLF
jgi:hypothetical protein